MPVVEYSDSDPDETASDSLSFAVGDDSVEDSEEDSEEDSDFDSIDLDTIELDSFDCGIDDLLPSTPMTTRSRSKCTNSSMSSPSTSSAPSTSTSTENSFPTFIAYKQSSPNLPVNSGPSSGTGSSSLDTNNESAIDEQVLSYLTNTVAPATLRANQYALNVFQRFASQDSTIPDTWEQIPLGRITYALIRFVAVSGKTFKPHTFYNVLCDKFDFKILVTCTV